MNVKGVIFDMDGLLVDSEPIWRKVEIACFAEVGLHLTEDQCRQTKGLRIDEVIDYWFNISPWEGLSKAQLVTNIVDEMESTLRKEAVALPGVLDVIDQCCKAGLTLSIASSSQLRLIQAVVEALNLKNSISICCSAEHEQYGKPHPAVFLTAASKMEIEPAHCVVFEDSLPGVIAAKSAKMNCIAVPEPEEINDVRFKLADRVLNSLEGFELSLIGHENLSRSTSI